MPSTSFQIAVNKPARIAFIKLENVFARITRAQYPDGVHNKPSILLNVLFYHIVNHSAVTNTMCSLLQWNSLPQR